MPPALPTPSPGKNHRKSAVALRENRLFRRPDRRKAVRLSPYPQSTYARSPGVCLSNLRPAFDTRPLVRKVYMVYGRPRPPARVAFFCAGVRRWATGEMWKAAPVCLACRSYIKMCLAAGGLGRRHGLDKGSRKGNGPEPVRPLLRHPSAIRAKGVRLQSACLLHRDPRTVQLTSQSCMTGGAESKEHYNEAHEKGLYAG
jgi:hypothetical protein